jgi:ribonuclease PH
MDTGALDQSPLLGQCAAVSVGVIDGEPRLDLCYNEDSVADIDMNVVMRSDGNFIEVQGCAEGDACPRSLLDALIELGEKGIQELFEIQKRALDGA